MGVGQFLAIGIDEGRVVVKCAGAIVDRLQSSSADDDSYIGCAWAVYPPQSLLSKD